MPSFKFNLGQRVTFGDTNAGRWTSLRGVIATPHEAPRSPVPQYTILTRELVLGAPDGGGSNVYRLAKPNGDPTLALHVESKLAAAPTPKVAAGLLLDRRMHTVQSSSRPGKRHDVVVREFVNCSCEGFTYRGSCKHATETDSLTSKVEQLTKEGGDNYEQHQLALRLRDQRDASESTVVQLRRAADGLIEERDAAREDARQLRDEGMRLTAERDAAVARRDVLRAHLDRVNRRLTEEIESNDRPARVRSAFGGTRKAKPSPQARVARLERVARRHGWEV